MEPVFIPLIVFSFIAIIVKMSLDHAKWKHQHKSGFDTEGTTMRLSELEGAFEDSLQRALAPIERRLDSLEKKINVLDEPHVKQLSKGAESEPTVNL